VEELVAQVAASGEAEDVKQLLLQALLLNSAGAEASSSQDFDSLLAKLRAARGRPQLAPDAQTVFLREGAWRLLGASKNSAKVAPRVEVFSGGHFLHDGSIGIIGLLGAIANKQAQEIKLGLPEVRISNTSLVVSVDTADSTPDRRRTLSYVANLTPLAPTIFQRSVQTLVLPEPIGTLEPLMRASDLIEVIYSDEDLLVVRDESGASEYLVHESVEKPNELEASGAGGEVFFRPRVLA